MSFEEFCRHIASGAAPSPDLSPALAALWLDRQGNWEAAHGAAQEDPGAAGAWVHAYLHRKEGDVSNAAYWYRRAGKPTLTAATSFETEWDAIARALLQ